MSFHMGGEGYDRKKGQRDVTEQIEGQQEKGAEKQEDINIASASASHTEFCHVT